jgi:tetratricopeptide (TPR) repeat protein
VAYVPYGFYVDRRPVFVREVTVVEEVPVEVPVYVDEDGNPIEPQQQQVEEPAPAEAELQPAPPPGAEIPEGEGVLHDPEGPPVLDATTEKYLREGSEHFVNADYEAAARSFRLAVATDPHAAPPRFAFGQALLAIGEYENAAKVLRGALSQEQALLRAPGSIVGVYKTAEEFTAVLNTLKNRSLQDRDNADLLFLIGYQQYFSGDPQAVVTFGRLAQAHPEDPMNELFGPALKERFPELANLPPIPEVEEEKE